MVGLDNTGALVRANISAVPIPNALTSGSNAITSNVGGSVSTLTPATGVISQSLGFNATGSLVKAGSIPPSIGPWISEPITTTSTGTSSPIKGSSVLYDYIRYRSINPKEYMIEMF